MFSLFPEPKKINNKVFKKLKINKKNSKRVVCVFVFSLFPEPKEINNKVFKKLKINKKNSVFDVKKNNLKKHEVNSPLVMN